MNKLLNFLFLALFLVSQVNLAKLKLASKQTQVYFKGYIKNSKTNQFIPKNLLKGVVISFTSNAGKVYSAKIGSEGTYKVNLPYGIYIRKVTSSNFKTEIKKICIQKNTGNYELKHYIYLTTKSSELLIIKGYIKSAINNKVIDTAELKNGNIKINYQDIKTKTVYDAEILPNGIYQVNLPVGVFQRTINMNNYSKMNQRISFKKSQGIEDQRSIIFLSPFIEGYRIVLTWGEFPKDLDSHLTLPDGKEVFFNNKASADGHITLDVDAQEGYGPETTTLKDITPGVYKYRVQKFSQEETPLSKSRAKVFVFFKDKLIKEIKIPINGSNEGDVWEVLTIDHPSGKINVTNKLIKLIE